MKLQPDVRELSVVPQGRAESRRPYTFVLLNHSNLKVHAVRTRRAGTNEPFSGWLRVNPPIGQTCTYPVGDNRCVTEGKYVPLCVVDCGYTWDVEAAVTNPAGEQGVASVDAVATDCNYEGGILTLY